MPKKRSGPYYCDDCENAAHQCECPRPLTEWTDDTDD